jgi:hypothetical protein
MLGGLYIFTCKKKIFYQIIFKEIYIFLSNRKKSIFYNTSYTYGVNYFDVDCGSCNHPIELPMN